MIPAAIAQEPADDIERLLDIVQVAGRLGVTTETIRQMVNRGDFPTPLAIGRQRRWRVAVFNAWVQARAQAPSKPKQRRRA